MWLFRVIVALIAVLGRNVHSQEDSYCTTPLGDRGICVNLKRCDGLVRLLRTQGNNLEVRNYLVRSSCGFDGTMPIVCCPDISSQFRTTPSPVSPVTFTVPPQIIPVFTKPSSPTTSSTTPSNVVTRFGNIIRPPHCGFSNDTSTRVVGGMPANLGEYPWMVALGYRNSKNPTVPRWLCGGTLITDRHILTAAHCVYNKNVYVARIGDLDLYSDDDGATPVNIPIINVKIHEGYSPTVFTNDIAILTLERSANLPYVWPVCLPVDEPIRSNRFENYNAFVSGWGAIYFNGPSSPHLQKVILPVVSNNQCKNAFAKAKTVIDERVLCAGYANGGKDACQGDSGGPLMYGSIVDNRKSFYQIGVVSYGFKCAEVGYPGVYTRVTEFLDWISLNI